MSALKDLSYKEDEDGELPSLVTGTESNIVEILNNTKSDGGINIISENKLSRANKQVEESGIIINNASSKTSTSKIPISIITGYLGSGKSTLLEMIAMKGSDKKIAVILNEFGDSSEIEKAMTIRNGSASYEEWLDLGNGCLCCSLKNIGVKAIEDMVTRSPGKIDYILLETSGIADPAPIAKMFWQDEGLNSCIYIDGIITVLDSENVLKCLDDISPETHWHGEKVIMENNLTVAHFQIAMADRILLNKFDKIENDPNFITKIEDRVRQINSMAPMYNTKYGDTPIDTLLDLHAYDNIDVESQINIARPTLHDPRMNTVTLTFRPLKSELEFQKFLKQFLQVLLWRDFGVVYTESDRITHFNDTKDWEIQRTKGLIIIEDTQSPNSSPNLKVKVIQGVRDTYDVLPGTDVSNNTQCKLVFIGKYLDKDKVQKFLDEILN
ncbi:hypothetical protein Kpol_325p2 [Vanderwaltozyma polyspora DSM 70294]|uniref:CobW/HypB/UreG nucleotide-binding domain-containing protein n=1 Tax=Vanderwaltozyma polyspora (strain ATCC 22028 / DSM 70294 / BCRC 21397 / CBS 2163 / NBRC 10782 / NRRL Y-8283 / UCD 57-17) TaxID=436907 RepID=A7TST5_VANPO|nr:uncharacterized protein Kpol_325p2 [Vanderwaltozyma polyspora DSM 70294]EDO14663.1 hypothetical protein Kpol_325p2 [Vanderwaltozyma polyspora DSM 70294]